MIKVRVGRRGQITIPSRLRRRTGIDEGDTLAVAVEDGNLILRPIAGTLRDLRGSVTVGKAQDFEAIRREVLADRARKAAESGK